MCDTFTVNIKSASANGVAFHVSDEIINQIAAILSLQYIPESEATGRVCFANDINVRPEYRDAFTYTHLQYYIYAQWHSQQDVQNIPYPVDAAMFWKLVGQGNNLY